jgi:hypothetical protein
MKQQSNLDPASETQISINISPINISSGNISSGNINSGVVFPRFPRSFAHASWKRVAIWAFLTVFMAGVSSRGWAQSSLPFEVSNPKNKKWPAEEASRIYDSACARVARAIRPDSPPHLHPQFVLVLGARDNETVRNGSVAEIRLKAWNAPSFAEAVVIMAIREVLNTEEVTNITRAALISAQASVSVSQLRRGR